MKKYNNLLVLCAVSVANAFWCTVKCAENDQATDLTVNAIIFSQNQEVGFKKLFEDGHKINSQWTIQIIGRSTERSFWSFLDLFLPSYDKQEVSNTLLTKVLRSAQEGIIPSLVQFLLEYKPKPANPMIPSRIIDHKIGTCVEIYPLSIALERKLPNEVVLSLLKHGALSSVPAVQTDMKGSVMTTYYPLQAALDRKDRENIRSLLIAGGGAFTLKLTADQEALLQEVRSELGHSCYEKHTLV